MVALDGKMIIDDYAIFRHPELIEIRDLDIDSIQQNQKQENLGYLYVNLDGEIGCMVNGAGLAMATMDIIQYYGGAPANFLDIGGGAGQKRLWQLCELFYLIQK